MQIKKSLTVLLFTILSFSLSNSLIAQDLQESIVEELDEISTIMMKAALDGNNLSIIDYYSDDIVLMPDFQPAIRGKNSLLKVLRDGMKKGIVYHSINGTPEKRWMVNDNIYERGTFGMSVSTKDDPKPKAYYGSYFQIWEKQDDGKYKISFNIWNLDFNPF